MVIFVVWVILLNIIFIFFWKATNLADFVILERISPLVCKMEEYKYKIPYSKLSKSNISESEWSVYQKVGNELIKVNPCPKYEDYVWFNLIEESLSSTFDEFIEK